MAYMAYMPYIYHGKLNPQICICRSVNPLAKVRGSSLPSPVRGNADLACAFTVSPPRPAPGRRIIFASLPPPARGESKA